MEPVNKLQRIGLSARQAKVFLACLELGLATANRIAERAKEKRTTVYVVLGQLKEKRLVSVILKKNKKYFSTINPRSMVDVWQEKQKQIKDQEDELLSLVPYLESIYKTSPRKPVVKFFQDRQGLRDLYNELIKDKKVKVIYYMSAVKIIEDLLGKKFYMNWIERRVKAGVKVVGIRNKAKELGGEVYTAKEKYLREYRFAPSWFNLPMEVNIIGDRVAIVSSQKESFGFIVESKEFSLLAKSWFDLLWQVSEES